MKTKEEILALIAKADQLTLDYSAVSSEAYFAHQKAKDEGHEIPQLWTDYTEAERTRRKLADDRDEAWDEVYDAAVLYFRNGGS